MNGTTVCVTAFSVRRLVPGLELLAEVAEEPPGKRSVDESVVVRERQVHDRADTDYVLAELVLDHPRALHNGVRAEDRRLWLADHGGPVEGAIATGVGDGERPALDIVRHELLLACALGD